MLFGLKEKGPTLRSRRRNLKSKKKSSMSADDLSNLYKVIEEVESIQFEALAVEPVKVITPKKRGWKPEEAGYQQDSIKKLVITQSLLKRLFLQKKQEKN